MWSGDQVYYRAYSDFQRSDFLPGGLSSKGAGCPAGDPVIPSTGAKVESVTDFVVPGEMGLKFTRYYHSQRSSAADVPGWRTSFDYWLDTTCNGANHCSKVTLYRPDGSNATFAGGNTVGVHPQTPSGVASLTTNADGTYTLYDEDGTVQTYPSGEGPYLQSVKDVSGIGWTITRSTNGTNAYSITATHTNGSSITLNGQIQYSSNGAITGVIETAKDPAGNVYSYVRGTNDNYTQVTLPGSPATVIQYKYDPVTQLLTEVDYNGVPYSITTYNSTGQATGTHMADGTQATTLLYATNATGPVTTITNALGHASVEQFGSGTYSPLLSTSGGAVVDCGSTINSSTYDSWGNPQQTTDNNGNVTSYTYAPNGQLQTMTEAYGTTLARTTNDTWDPNVALNRLLSTTVVGISKTAFTYNAQNRMATMAVTNLTVVGTSNQTLTTQYNYTLYGNGMVQTKSVIHPSPGNSDTDVYSYDTMGNLVSIANGLGQTTTYSNYNGLGEPQQIVSPNGAVTKYTYDARGRVATKTTYPYGIAGSWTYTYDGFGLLYTLTTPDDEVTTWNRNAYMQVSSIARNDKDGTSTESFSYDAMGDVTSDVIARGSDIGLSKTVVYDAVGRPYQRKGANGQVETYAYDGNGNLLSMTDALGNKTSFQYDALDRKTRTIDAKSGTTQSTYDAADHVASVTDPRGLVTSYAYDGLGQLWQQVSPDTGTTHYAHDSYGRQSSLTRADGTQTTYGFDGLNRTTSISAGGQTQSFTYDSCTNGKGQLCAASDATGTTSYTYTPEGWVSGRGFSVSGTTYALGYNYDAEGRLTVVDYPDGNKAIYYRTNGVVNSVLLSVGSSYFNGATAITYRPGNLAMAAWTSSNGLVNTASYDSDMRMTGISVPGVQSLGFSYDTANRLNHIANGVDSTMTESITYDALSRLSTVTSTADNESYQYDADGNRTTATVNGWGQTSTIDPNSNKMIGYTYVGGNPLMRKDPSGLAGTNFLGTAFCTGNLCTLPPRYDSKLVGRSQHGACVYYGGRGWTCGCPCYSLGSGACSCRPHCDDGGCTEWNCGRTTSRSWRRHADSRNIESNAGIHRRRFRAHPISAESSSSNVSCGRTAGCVGRYPEAMPLKSEETNTALLWDKVASARAGDHKEAIAVAMLIHKFPLIARRTGLSSEYEFFLNSGMRSNDPEVLVAAGEALFQGKRLARNVRQGMRYFAKANKLSPFMGAFMIARLDIFQNRPVVRKMLEKGAKAGHIPSAYLLDKLRYRKVKKYSFIFAFPSLVFFAIKCSRLVTAGLKDKDNLYMRFWRYRDTEIARDKELAKTLPVDRASPFDDIEAVLSD